MAVRFVGSHRQARVEKENSVVCPWREEAAVLGRFFEGGIISFESDVHVLEGWGSGRWWPDGETESMGLVVVVVGVLTEDYGFDCIEGCMS